ncbi:MAG: energy-coupling factor ABC transporter ATP-binding protein [Propionibacteriaceae bacterium]|nr:energy-coupling factor ABC transporter ATP-binding protein [Propionibacteriaceae bacterium]
MLKLSEVTLSYPDKTKAIDRASFALGQAENIALIGENGAGKTSLLLAIVGILEPESGTIEIDGTLLNKTTVNELRRRTGFVFQNPDDQLFMPLIYDDVAFGCRNAGLDEVETKRRVEETLASLQISQLKNRSSLKLSGGEKRMAAIATVLVTNPCLLLFDEPTAFLDPKAKRALIAALKQMKQPKIIATHDMAFAAEVCDRVIVLKDGRVTADDDFSLLENQEFLQSQGL